MTVYINDIAAFLPNDPVDNDHMEEILGKVHNIPSRIKARILKNNGIATRYYSIDPRTGKLNYTNAQLTAEAIRKLRPFDGFSVDQIQCLCCGTTIADVICPGHGLMVQGELKNPPCEVISTSGICLSGITAFKAAYMNVALKFSDNAVATGSDAASSLMRSNFFEHLKNDSALGNHLILSFESDFLRWMLSDAAGAIFLSRKKNKNKISLRVDWFEHVSYAGEMEVCMYAGAVKNDDGTVTGWRELGSLAEALEKNFFALKQDTSILNQEIVNVCVNKALVRTINRRKIKAEDIAWFLPHYSSEYFRDKLHDAMAAIGFDIPYEKWFTNLSYKGNTGSASIYVILEEIFHSGRLKKGDKILCFIPESGRFSVAYVLLTVV
ncbi:MAG: 3-oxoacyl-(acyl-carrier-protein) synthase 3 [Smithella sp. PtaU1.Bin162]|nr:MAG: 3-oxoacyl-(acyl-carrier-protein) synthase 3 [Smithella sp. PtaU1.Bin162]